MRMCLVDGCAYNRSFCVFSWATVCKTIRPIGPLSVCVFVLSVTLVYCEGRPRPRPHCVRWRPSSPKKAAQQLPHFSTQVGALVRCIVTISVFFVNEQNDANVCGWVFYPYMLWMADSCVAVLFTHVWVIAIYEHEHFTKAVLRRSWGVVRQTFNCCFVGNLLLSLPLKESLKSVSVCQS